MKILSFDIGVKTMAYCVTEYNNETDMINIVSPCATFWNIINLTGIEAKKCESPACESNVTLCAIVNGENRYYCGRHKKVHTLYVSVNKFNSIDTDDVNVICQHSVSCKKKSKYIINEKYLCNVHKNMIEKNEEKNRLLKKYKVFVKDFTINDLKMNLLREFDKRRDIFLNVDAVCIENQPNFNIMMSSLGNVVWTYFGIRGIVDKDINNSKIEKLTFFAAANKAKINNKEKEQYEEINNASNKYKKTKQMSVDNCRMMLAHDQSCIDHLDTFKKKDDMCDAFIHGAYFIQKMLRGSKKEESNNISTKALIV